jgi:hypothetical protein
VLNDCSWLGLDRFRAFGRMDASRKKERASLWTDIFICDLDAARSFIGLMRAGLFQKAFQ